MTSNLPIEFAKTTQFMIPSCGLRPEVHLDMSLIYQGEHRLVEARTVNPAIYGDLEILFTQGDAQARKLYSIVGYELAMAKKMLRAIKSEIILDDWQDYKKEHKLTENATNRDAFLERNSKFVEIQDHIDMLTALETLLEGKTRIFKEVRTYMRKQIDILLRGIALDKYISK